MVSNVGNVGNNNNNNSQATSRPTSIKVKRGENLTIIAKRYGMTKAEFVKWTGLSGVIKVGQTINLPTAKVESGKGIYAIARKYNMTMAEFAKLNNISDPQNYQAKAGEVFYVKSQTSSGAAQGKPKKSASQSASNTGTDAASAGAAIGASVGTLIENKQKWGSSYTPEELGKNIYELSCKYNGAVGKPDFDALINEINPKNASAVIKAYPENPENDDKESLIHTITREIRSTKQSRKDAVMKVYDALAKEKNAPAAKREEFVTELNAQFDSWGLVDTKKLDSIIDELLKMKTPVPAAKPTTPSTAGNERITTVPKEGKGKTFTAAELQRSAINSAKNEAKAKFKEYCKANNIKYDESLLDYGAINRIPLPTVKDGKIVAKEQVFQPKGKSNGKVVIVNAGHGAYSSRTGYFDPGSYSFIKKGNGKYAPLLEYDKMKSYSEDAVERLRNEGYTVILTNAHVETMSDQGTLTNIVSGLKQGKYGKKYKNNEIMMISLHADSEPGQSGAGVCYDSRFSDDVRLTDIMVKNLNEGAWIKAGKSERNWNVPKKGIQVLHQTESIPSVLLETEYVNGSKSQNLDSPAYQKQFLDQMIKGINEYWSE